MVVEDHTEVIGGWHKFEDKYLYNMERHTCFHFPNENSEHMKFTSWHFAQKKLTLCWLIWLSKIICQKTGNITKTWKGQTLTLFSSSGSWKEATVCFSWSPPHSAFRLITFLQKGIFTRNSSSLFCLFYASLFTLCEHQWLIWERTSKEISHSKDFNRFIRNFYHIPQRLFFKKKFMHSQHVMRPWGCCSIEGQIATELCHQLRSW